MLMYAHIPTLFDSILISLNEHHRDFWSLENGEFLFQPQLCIIAMFEAYICQLVTSRKEFLHSKCFNLVN